MVMELEFWTHATGYNILKAVDFILTIFELSHLKINILLKRPFLSLSLAGVELGSSKDNQDRCIIMY